MLSRTLLIALDGTLSACVTIHSQVSSQDPLKHTPENALKDAPNCTRWHTPSLLDCMLPNTLPRGKTLPISLDYMPPCMLLRARSGDLLSCRPPGAGRREAGGRWCVAGGGWRVACDGRNHDVGRYHSLNLIFCAATTMRSHDASRSWCLLTIAAIDSAGMVDNCILGRADLRLRFSSRICSTLPIDCGCMQCSKRARPTRGLSGLHI
jgi:hypothetical protein